MILGNGFLPMFSSDQRTWIASYLLRDTYATVRSAGAVNGTAAEPGPGTRNVVDTGSRVSISNGYLSFVSGVAVANADPLYYLSPSVTNAAGVAYYSRLRLDYSASANGWAGLHSVGAGNSTPNILAHQLFQDSVQPYISFTNVAHGITLGGNAIDLETLIISRAPGGFHLHRGCRGDWELVWVDNARTATNLWIRNSGVGRPMAFAEQAAIDPASLPAIWRDPYGIATERKATTSAGDSIAATANTLIEHTITAATGVTQEIMVRRADDSNCWIVRMPQSGGIKLFEKVAGVETERATASQTWTNATAYRVVVRCDCYHIRVFVGNTMKIFYTSCRSNATATSVKVSHAGTDLISYPIRFSNLDLASPVPQKTYLPYGDSKTRGEGDATTPYPDGRNGWAYRLSGNLTTATGMLWAEFPQRIARSGYTTVTMQPYVDGDIAARYGAPDFILCGLGANDISTSQANFETNYAYIIDTLHAKFPAARVLVALPWRQGFDSLATSMDNTWIPNIVNPRSAWCGYGPDERVVLKGADNGATNTVDGVHPNAVGHAAMAVAWQSAMGF